MVRRQLFVAVAVAVVVAVSTAACTIGSTGLPPLEDAVSWVRLVGDDTNVLRGRLEVRTDRPARLRVELRNEDHALAVSGGALATSHRFPLMQLRADRDYEVHLEVLDRSGAVVGAGAAGTFTTGPLPDDLPPITVDVAEVDAMTPGLTLFDQSYRPPKVEGVEAADDEGFLTATDETGQVVWYHREPFDIQDANRLDDGDLLFISDETGARRITPFGETVAEWRGTSPGSDEEDIGYGLDREDVIDVDIHSMHHEILELPDGNLVTLSREMREVTYPEPLCDEDGGGPSVEQIVGDTVAVFEPDTGRVVDEHSLFDALDPMDDPRKLKSDLCIDYLDRHFPDAEPRDWTHGNGVIPIDDGRLWLVSLRHTDELVAIHTQDSPNGEAGSLAWSLGPDGDFELQGDGLWFWHQHAPELQEDGTILVYDNGNGRLDADTPYSRAARYRIDPEARTAEEVWQHDLGPDLYAFFVGDADRLDGTVLIDHGGQANDCETTEDEDDVYAFGRIIEVDESSGEVVFDLRTEDPETCTGWAIYRAERIPTIYPPAFEVEVLRR